MHDFDFLEPASVAEASRLAGELGDDCRVIAGGTALVLVMRQRMIAPTHLVSLGRLDLLRAIAADRSGWLRIGALCTHAEVATSPLVRQQWPMLASMAERVANPQVRHQGTIGGNLCYGDPSTDPPGCLLALDAQVVVESVRGERVIPMADFLVDYYTTALAPDEILTEIRVPPQAPGSDGVYTRYLRTAADHRPLLSVAVHARRQGAACEDIRLAIGASTPIPTRVPRAEALLRGQVVTLELAAQAGEIVAADIEAVSDARGEAGYRREVARAVAARSIAQLFGLAQE